MTGKGSRFQEYFTNAGWDMDTDGFYYPKLEYVKTSTFAADCAIVRTAWPEGDFEIRLYDWKAWYRQILRHPQLYWLYASLSIEDGVVFDKFAIFGDGSSVPWSNFYTNALMHCIRFMLVQDWGLGDDCSQWAARLAALPQWPKCTRRWIRERTASLGQPSAPSWKKLKRKQAFKELKKLFNLVPICLSAYFDDTQTASGQVGADMVTQAILRLVKEGGVGAQFKKFERFTFAGHRYQMNEKTEWVLDCDEHGEPLLRHPKVLGKEFCIKDMTRRDPESRLAEVINLTHAVIERARKAPTRLVPVAAGERLRGQWNWVLDTCPSARSLMFGLSASLAVASRVGKGNRNFGRRRSQKLSMAKAAFAQDQAKAWQWDKWEISQYFPLSHQAEEELLQMVRILPFINETAWFPRRSPVPLSEIAYIVSDSAGMSGKDESAVRGAAAWLLAAILDTIPFIIEEWEPEVLRTTHSTQQESANACANLEHWANDPALRHITVFVEVLDSASSVANMRRMAARRPGLQRVLERRRKVVRALNQRGVRVITLWNARRFNFIADLLSKYKIEEAREALEQRAPNKHMEGKPTPRARNVLNSKRVHFAAPLACRR